MALTAVGHSGCSGDGGCVGEGAALGARTEAVCFPSLLVSISALPGAECSYRMWLFAHSVPHTGCLQMGPGTPWLRAPAGQHSAAPALHSPGLCPPSPCRQPSTTLLLDASAHVGWGTVEMGVVQGPVGWHEDSLVGKAKAVPSAKLGSPSRG